jgi:PAS domain-containing protein
VLNIPSGTLIGRRVNDLGFSQGDADEWNDAIGLVFSKAVSRQLRVRFSAQGGEMVLDWRLIPEFDGEGHVATVLSLQRDITETQRAQDKIRHLASFTQLNPNPILELDAQGRILFSNVATKLALRRIGAPEDPDLFKPPDLPGILRELSQGNQALFYREVEIGDALFGERIFLTPEQGTVRIYATDITRLR